MENLKLEVKMDTTNASCKNTEYPKKGIVNYDSITTETSFHF